MMHYQSTWKFSFLISNRKYNNSLAEGIDKAIARQQALLKQSITTFEKQLIVRSGPFRYATVSDSDSLFVHPLSVHRLGTFIMEIIQVCPCFAADYQQEFEQNKKKPFVLSFLNEAAGSYTVIGYMSCSAPSLKKRK